MSRRPLLKGVAVLFASGLLSRILGSYYRIVLARTISTESLGLFQMLLPTFRFAHTFQLLGIPVAMAQLIAARGAKSRSAKQVSRLGLSIIGMTTVITCTSLWFLAPYLAQIAVGDPRATLAVRAMILVLIPIGLSHGWRARFQGEQNLTPNAVSQSVEALARIPVVLALLGLVAGLAVGSTVAAIMVGMAVGEGTGFLVLFLWRRFQSNDKSGTIGRPRSRARSRSRIITGVRDTFSPTQVPLLKQMGKIAIPLWASQLLNNLLFAVYVALIPRRLTMAGLSHQEAMTFYGQFSGMAIPVLYLPMIFVTPITQVLIPGIAERAKHGAGDRSVRALLLKSLTVATLVGIVTWFGQVAFARQISLILYGTEEIVDLLPPLGILAPMVYLNSVTASALYGLGQTGATLRHSLVGSSLRVGLVYVLAAMPTWGPQGVIAAVVADYGLTSILNGAYLWHVVRRNEPLT